VRSEKRGSAAMLKDVSLLLSVTLNTRFLSSKIFFT
jgi:hypothetical protein